MTIERLAPGDRDLLSQLAAAEPNAKQRDRYRAVGLAMDGLTGDDVAERVGRSPRFVDAWVARYRAGGIGALRPAKQPGRKPKLTPAQAERLRARLDAGPTPADGVCALRGKDVCRIIEAELGVTHTIGGTYAVLKRLDFSSLLPRPRHRKNDPAAMAAFTDRAPFFARDLAAKHPGKRVRWFVQDEARVGQQGTLTRVWARTGSRPTVVRQTEYEWVYLWAAVEPATGASVAMVAPTVNAGLMTEFLAGLSGTLAADEHAVLALDNAGWHTAKALAVPANVTLLNFPPYSPELNPVENLWAYMRGHYLSSRVYTDYDELLAETDAAWSKLDPATLKSVCGCPWIERASQA